MILNIRLTKYIASAALTGCCLLASPDALADRSKLDVSALVLLDDHLSQPEGRTEVQMMNALVSFDSRPDCDALAAAGYTVQTLFEGRGEWFAVLTMPVSELDSFTDREEVTALSMGVTARPLLNNARRVTNVNDVHAGKLGMDDPEYNIPYTGAGVLTGIVDVGIDPAHINFQDADGNLRIKRYLRMTSANITEYRTADKILAAPTDNNSQTHGTHVAGIMGGSYSGNGKFSWYDTAAQTSDGSRVGDDVANPYLGVAYGADLMLAGGSCTTSNIITAIDRIFQYAESEGQPAVVNLSLGINNDSHDGTSVTERALAALGERGIIVISAGNEADGKMSMVHTFGDDGAPMQTLLTPDADGTTFSGNFELWGPDLTELDVKLIVVDALTGEILYSCDCNQASDQWAGLATATYQNSYFERPAVFTNNFTGSLRVLTHAGSSNPDRRQYYINATGLGYSRANSSKSIRVGLSVSAPAGTRVWLYGDSACPFDDGKLKGFRSGDGEASINTMCCAANVLSVGSYCTNRSIVTVDNQRYYYSSSTLNDISPFSSYGELIDGRKLPHICAPGAAIGSSMSGPYAAAHSDPVVGMVQVKTKKHYWTEMQGTSMSAPFMAGVVALWLEADPTLTIDDIIDILSKTALRDARVKTSKRPVQWGYGKVNALAGLKEVLTRRIESGVTDVSVDETSNPLLLDSTGDGWQAFMAGEDVELLLCDLHGRTLSRVQGRGSATLTTAGVTPGLYLLRATGGSRSVTRKIAVN